MSDTPPTTPVEAAAPLLVRWRESDPGLIAIDAVVSPEGCQRVFDGVCESLAVVAAGSAAFRAAAGLGPTDPVSTEKILEVWLQKVSDACKVALVEWALGVARQGGKLRFTDLLDVEVPELRAGQPLSMRFVAVATPVLRREDLAGLRLERPEVQVDAQALDAALTDLAKLGKPDTAASAWGAAAGVIAALSDDQMARRFGLRSAAARRDYALASVREQLENRRDEGIVRQAAEHVGQHQSVPVPAVLLERRLRERSAAVGAEAPALEALRRRAPEAVAELATEVRTGLTAAGLVELLDVDLSLEELQRAWTAHAEALGLTEQASLAGWNEPLRRQQFAQRRLTRRLAERLCEVTRTG